MVFIRKNLQAKRRNMAFIKGATLFFLGMSAVLFMAQAFDIGVVVPNTIQYIQKVFLTADGSNIGTTGIMLDGTPAGGITITNLTNKKVLGTDSNGKIIEATSGDVYTLIAGLLGGSQGAIGTGIISGYVNGGILYLQYSGAYGSGTWNLGTVQGLPGAAGAAGTPGTNGTNGINGTNGSNGRTGYSVVMTIVLTGSSGTNGQCPTSSGNIISFYADTGYNGYDPSDIYLTGLIICSAGGQGAQGNTGAIGTGIISGYVNGGVLYLQYSGVYGSGTWNLGTVQGLPGAAGAAGTPGTPGTNGTNGTNGAAGATGATGFLDGGIQGATPYYNGSKWVTGDVNIFNTGGNVGIGTTTPGYKLDVNGTGSFKGVCLLGVCRDTWPTAGASYWSAGVPTNSIYYGLGNVGIGINNPSSTLSIGGIAGGSLFVDGTANFAIGEADSSFLISDGVNGTNAMQVDNDTQKAVLFDSNNGGYNVGIGTKTPTTKLSIVDGGTINVAPGLKNSYINMIAPDTFGTPVQGLDIGYINSGALELGYLWSKSGSGLLLSADQTDTHLSRLDMTINTAGNVGIGQVSAGARLHVAGDGKFTTSVQVGVPAVARCTTQADAGKIVYEVLCVGGGTYIPAFVGCTQTGNQATVSKGIIMTGASWNGASCGVGIEGL